MPQDTLSFLLRSLFIVLATVTAGMAVSSQIGLTIKQSVLISLPIGFFAASLMTLLYLARAGAQGDKTQQLLVLLAIEFLLVPIASAAAIVAYFL